MGFNRDVIRRRRDELDALGRPDPLGRPAAAAVEAASSPSSRTPSDAPADNDVLTLQFCVNYGGRAEIADAARGARRDVAAGTAATRTRSTSGCSRATSTSPDLPDVDLFLRSSGEQRTSNFLLWQAAYAEMVFLDTLWPDFDRRHLWQAVETYASRDRRYGGADPSATAV